MTRRPNPKTLIAAAVALGLALPGAAAIAAGRSGHDGVLAFYEDLARRQSGAFDGFSAARGETLFRASHAGGKPETPACTSCHGDDTRAPGRTRAGKVIEPLAASAAPERYTDTAKTEKWFLRNCRSVLGRECTPEEKGDFITFMLGE